MKKKTNFAVISLIIVMIAFVLLPFGCANVYKLDASNFLKQAKQIGEIHTVKNTEMIGVSGDRVYLEYWNKPLLFGSGITVYWTCLSGLPSGLADELKAGENPWKDNR